MEQKFKTPIEYIKEAWRMYTKKESFIRFARIMSVVSILTFSIGLLIGYLFPSTYAQNIDFSNVPLLIGFIFMSIVSFVIGLWGQTTTYFSVIDTGSTEKEIFRKGFSKMLKFFLVSLAVGIIVVFGLVLLIVPAILFGVWYSFSVLLVLDKNLGLKEALRTSKSMVQGKFWKVLGRFVVFGLFGFMVSVLLSVIPYAGSIALSFIAPFLMLPTYLLYRDLSINN